jgi:plastocyanin
VLLVTGAPVALPVVVAAYAGSSGPAIAPTSDPEAARFCLDQAGLKGQPQWVDGIEVVAVCVENYQYMPGDDNMAPCAGYIAGTPMSQCMDAAKLPAVKLEIPQGARLLFDVPDPNMHTLTFVGCPNSYVDPSSPDPAGAFNSAVSTAEQAAFGPDEIHTQSGPCRFDSYPENGGVVPDKPGAGALQGPGYETVDTSHLPPGTYHFYCQVHAFMRGTLIVDPPKGKR